MSEPAEDVPDGEEGGTKKPRATAGSDSDSSICDVCDLCDGCNLLRLSTVLLAVAAAGPPRSAVLAGLGFYRRRLTRFTPRCPSTPSRSAYTVDAVRHLGTRRGLAAAARRIRACTPIG